MHSAAICDSRDENDIDPDSGAITPGVDSPPHHIIIILWWGSAGLLLGGSRLQLFSF